MERDSRIRNQTHPLHTNINEAEQWTEDTKGLNTHKLITLDYWLICVDFWHAFVCIAWTFDSVLFSHNDKSNISLSRVIHYENTATDKTPQNTVYMFMGKGLVLYKD